MVEQWVTTWPGNFVLEAWWVHKYEFHALTDEGASASHWQLWHQLWEAELDDVGRQGERAVQG